MPPCVSSTHTLPRYRVAPEAPDSLAAGGASLVAAAAAGQQAAAKAITETAAEVPREVPRVIQGVRDAVERGLLEGHAARAALAVATPAAVSTAAGAHFAAQAGGAVAGTTAAEHVPAEPAAASLAAIGVSMEAPATASSIHTIGNSTTQAFIPLLLMVCEEWVVLGVHGSDASDGRFFIFVGTEETVFLTFSQRGCWSAGTCCGIRAAFCPLTAASLL